MTPTATQTPTADQTSAATRLNGLDTTQMADTIRALESDPTLARFEFRARNRWISGGENRSTIKDFYGAGAEDASRATAFEFTNGEPPVLLGDNEGANPVEFLLHALAGCVTTTTVLHAAARGIEIESLSTRLVGQLDIRGLVALGDVFAGYEHIRIEMDIKAANASDAELDDLLQFAKEHSPVCNTVCRPIPVVIERTRR
ncbi:MAG: OsmC family protein [Vicinamibacterales bacterium]